MALKRRTRKKTATNLPAKRRTRSMVKKGTSRRRKTTTAKFDIVNNLLMPAAGAGLGIIAGNQIAKMVPSIPYGKSLIPFGLAYVTGTMLKQPALAAGLAAAGGINLLQSFSPSMFADESNDFMALSPVPMTTFQDDLTEYQSALINGQFSDDDIEEIGTLKYDAMGRAIMQSPTGELTYL